MALIATIDGKPVYSDKRMKSVINTRVTFTDGSWCDVATGEVHNNGAGYVNIGGSDSGSVSDKVTEGPKQVTASALEVRGVAADVQVDVHNKSGIEYTITGLADEVKAIRANVQGGTLVIEGDGSGSSSGGVTIMGGDSSVIQTGRGRTVISGGRGSIAVGGNIVMSNVFGRGNMTVVTGGGGGENAVKVTVKVPQGTPVAANRVLGNVTIGDTNGPLTASVQGMDVYAGRVTNAQLSVQGSGDVRIKEVNGVVMAQVQGSGDIEIERGTMPSLTATVQGSGDINVGGTATTASLTVQGSGDIRVAHVLQRPMENVMGSGDIRVRRVG
jgi:hypothetical protein